MKPLYLAVALSLTACVPIETSEPVSEGAVYIEPQSDQTARLRVISSGRVDVTPGSTCIDSTHLGAGRLLSIDPTERQRNGESLNMPMGQLSRQFLQTGMVMTEVRLAANRPFAFRFQPRLVGEDLPDCQRMMYFVPEADKDYELLLLDGARCMATLKWVRNEYSQYPIKMQETADCPQQEPARKSRR